VIDRLAGVTVDDAARTVGCVSHPIRCDFNVLHDAGFPVYDDCGHNWRRSVTFAQRTCSRDC
jgi:hypothetical protein